VLGVGIGHADFPRQQPGWIVRVGRDVHPATPGRAALVAASTVGVFLTLESAARAHAEDVAAQSLREAEFIRRAQVERRERGAILSLAPRVFSGGVTRDRQERGAVSSDAGPLRGAGPVGAVFNGALPFLVGIERGVGQITLSLAADAAVYGPHARVPDFRLARGEDEREREECDGTRKHGVAAYPNMGFGC